VEAASGTRGHILVKFFLLVILSSTFLPPSALSAGYTWKTVIAGGGGFVPGIIYHPAARGLAYARTDMGGAYRWILIWAPYFSWGRPQMDCGNLRTMVLREPR